MVMPQCFLSTFVHLNIVHQSLVLLVDLPDNSLNSTAWLWPETFDLMLATLKSARAVSSMIDLTTSMVWFALLHSGSIAESFRAKIEAMQLIPLGKVRVECQAEGWLIIAIILDQVRMSQQLTAQDWLICWVTNRCFGLLLADFLLLVKSVVSRCGWRWLELLIVANEAAPASYVTTLLAILDAVTIVALLDDVLSDNYASESYVTALITSIFKIFPHFYRDILLMLVIICRLMSSFICKIIRCPTTIWDSLGEKRSLLAFVRVVNILRCGLLLINILIFNSNVAGWLSAFFRRVIVHQVINLNSIHLIVRCICIGYIIVVPLHFSLLQGRLTQNLGLFPTLLFFIKNLFLDQNSLSLDWFGWLASVCFGQSKRWLFWRSIGCHFLLPLLLFDILAIRLLTESLILLWLL